MSRWRCLSCSGEYEDTLPDGSAYFHACPPARDPLTGEVHERPDRRDERPMPGAEVVITGQVVELHLPGRPGIRGTELPAIPIVSAGAGRRQVGGP